MRRILRLLGCSVAAVVLAACTKFSESDPAPIVEGGIPDAASEVSAPPLEAGADAADAAVLTDAAKPSGSRVMFLTSAMYTGNLGGFVGADVKCNAAAAASELSAIRTKKFGAWISTSISSAASRFSKDSRPILTPKQEVLAANGWSEIASSAHTSEILLDENGKLVSTVFEAWTATTASGAIVPVSFSSCTDWTTESGTGIAGNGSQVDEAWSNEAARSCATPSRLYCLEL